MRAALLDTTKSVLNKIVGGAASKVGFPRPMNAGAVREDGQEADQFG